MQTTVKTCKSCFKCLNKLPLEAFYKHSAMGDGRLNKCKECTKKDVLAHRQENLEKVRAYDKFRAGFPHRVAARKEYGQTNAGKASHKRALQKSRITKPDRAFARNAVSNAVRDGRLAKLPCLICGNEKVEGHHPDYSRPLDVVWLCEPHHKQTHAMARQYKEAA